MLAGNRLWVLRMLLLVRPWRPGAIDVESIEAQLVHRHVLPGKIARRNSEEQHDWFIRNVQVLMRGILRQAVTRF